jgi:hypothetical protein
MLWSDVRSIAKSHRAGHVAKALPTPLRMFSENAVMGTKFTEILLQMLEG